MSFWLAVAGICVAGCAVGFAEQPPSVEVGILSRDGIGARPLALGNAYVALAEGSTSGYYNPAALGRSAGTSIGGMYESKFDPAAGISFQFLSATYGLPETGLGAALTLVRRSDQDIPTEGGTFDATESLILASAGYDTAALFDLPWDGNLAVGLSAKLFTHRGLGARSADGLGIDVGVLGSAILDRWVLHTGYRSSDTAGTTIQWTGTTHEIAERVAWGHHLGFGIAFPDWSLQLAGEIGIYPSEPDLNSAHVGVEFVVFNFAIRAGLSDGTPAFGVGMEILPGLTIDAAILLHSGLGQSIVASSEFSF
jgi:hypothetical protein